MMETPKMEKTPAAADSGIPTLEPTQQHPEATLTLRDESYTVIGPRRTTKRTVVLDDDEPIVDTTELIPVKSKRTERQQKKREQKLKKTTVKSDTKNFLELPPELLEEVLSYLRPSDLFRLLRLNKSTAEFIRDHDNSIVRDVIRRRYWVVSRCFPLPVPTQDVEPNAKECLLTSNWQERLLIHKGPYQQFIKMHEPSIACSCMTCVFAWNHLNLVLDLAHFQKNLSEREPIPMIARGTYPEWNRKLIDFNASIVEKAMSSPLYYALILQVHLSTIVGTLTRQVRVGKRTFYPERLYHLSSADVDADTDEFLERSGPHSFEMPVHRDNYYKLEAYVPNRKWGQEEQRWMYFSAKKMHENDVSWVANNSRFQPHMAPNAGIEKSDLRDCVWRDSPRAVKAYPIAWHTKNELKQLHQNTGGS